ncbi:hypothetical protein SEVIR_7G263850v4 [Setaria viridis]
MSSVLQDTVGLDRSSARPPARWCAVGAFRLDAVAAVRRFGVSSSGASVLCGAARAYKRVGHGRAHRQCMRAHGDELAAGRLNLEVEFRIHPLHALCRRGEEQRPTEQSTTSGGPNARGSLSLDEAPRRASSISAARV